MLKVGLRRRFVPEVFGQAFRTVVRAFSSAVGVVPVGDTGGTNVSMFKRLPIAPDMAYIRSEK
jgi:hypothetical protein